MLETWGRGISRLTSDRDVKHRRPRVITVEEKATRRKCAIRRKRLLTREVANREDSAIEYNSWIKTIMTKLTKKTNYLGNGWGETNNEKRQAARARKDWRRKICRLQRQATTINVKCVLWTAGELQLRKELVKLSVVSQQERTNF